MIEMLFSQGYFSYCSSHWFVLKPMSHHCSCKCGCYISSNVLNLLYFWRKHWWQLCLTLLFCPILNSRCSIKSNKHHWQLQGIKQILNCDVGMYGLCCLVSESLPITTTDIINYVWHYQLTLTLSIVTDINLMRLTNYLLWQNKNR